MTPSVSYKRRTTPAPAVDLSRLSLIEIARAVKNDEATIADAAAEYELRQRLGLNPDEPRTYQTSGSAR